MSPVSRDTAAGRAYLDLLADVVLLARRHPADAAELLAALRATAAHRESVLRPLAGWLDRLGPLRQASWSAYLDRSGLAEVFEATNSGGALNLVFVGGLNWAAGVPAQLVSGNNIVYADHAYTGNASDVVSNNLSLWTSLSVTEPIVVTEFGSEFDPSDGIYDANAIAFAQA